MSAVAHLRVRTAANAVSVPAAAVFSTGGHEAVWVVRDGKAVQQQVVVGVQGEDLVQISNGLQSGQTVVVTGTDQVTRRPRTCRDAPDPRGRARGARRSRSRT